MPAPARRDMSFVHVLRVGVRADHLEQGTRSRALPPKVPAPKQKHTVQQMGLVNNLEWSDLPCRAQHCWLVLSQLEHIF
jgi:hypothetical protein